MDHIRKTLLSTVITILFIIPNVTYAKDIVSGFVGAWIGEGVARPNGFGPPERIKCKVEGSLSSPTQVGFGGRCATVSGSGEFRLLIAQDETGQAIAATVILSTSSERTAFSGRVEGGIIRLFQKQPVVQGERVITSVMTLEVSSDDSSINMQSVVTDTKMGEDSQSLVIQFHKEE